MAYETPRSLRMALEKRLLTRSADTGVSLARLRRRVLFERIVARLEAAEPGSWVVKGGMALEVRLRDDARLTKDIDLGLRRDVGGAAALHERLRDALTADPDGDGFVLSVDVPVPLATDGAGDLTWRVKVAVDLAEKPFGGIKVDISPRTHELQATDRMVVPNSLEFAGIPATVIEIIEINRHAAEKLHGMLRAFGDRENTRVRDLVDLVILSDHGLLDARTVALATRQVWAERSEVEPPVVLPPLPESWPRAFDRLVADHAPDIGTFPEAVALVHGLWAEMFPTEET